MSDKNALKQYLEGIDTSDAQVEDGFFNKLGGAVRGAIQGWKKAGNNGGSASTKPSSLEEHDKRFHPNGYKEGDRCSYRDGLKKKDNEDKIDSNQKHQIVGGVKSGKESASGMWPKDYAKQLLSKQREYAEQHMRDGHKEYTPNEEAVQNYLKMTKKPAPDRDETISNIATKHGPSSRAMLVDPEKQNANEEDRQKKVRDALSFHGIEESSLSDQERKELGLRKPITIKKVSSPWRTEEEIERDAEAKKKASEDKKRLDEKLSKIPSVPMTKLHTPFANSDEKVDENNFIKSKKSGLSSIDGIEDMDSIESARNEWLAGKDKWGNKRDPGELKVRDEAATFAMNEWVGQREKRGILTTDKDKTDYYRNALSKGGYSRFADLMAKLYHERKQRDNDALFGNGEKEPDDIKEDSLTPDQRRKYLARMFGGNSRHIALENV